MNQSYSVHAPLEPLTVWVNSAAFYNMEGENHPWVKAKVFGISCLKGRVPCFEIITAEGYVFSDIPPHFVRFQQTASPIEYPLSSLVYNNALSTQFTLSHFPELACRQAYVYFKDENQYMAARYWFSLDFHENNNWYHAMKLDNGQISFIPSHKIIFPENGKIPENHMFPAYKKLRKNYSV